jgi:hypothetical protein
MYLESYNPKGSNPLANHACRTAEAENRSCPVPVAIPQCNVPDDVLEEDLEDAAGLLVDDARDTLHTSTARQTAGGGSGDT